MLQCLSEDLEPPLQHSERPLDDVPEAAMLEVEELFLRLWPVADLCPLAEMIPRLTVWHKHP